MRTTHQLNDITVEMEAIIISLLMCMQANKCADCGEELHRYQLCHNRYGEDITIYDLALKCDKCHALEHNIKAPRGVCRII